MDNLRDIEGQNNSEKKRRIVFAVLSLIMMILIFLFSAKNADQSSEESLKVGIEVGKVVVRDFEKLPKPEQINYARSIDFYVRKSAHFSEYALLGILLFGAVFTIKRKMYANALIALIIAMLYASSDEFHQLFVPGRSGQIRDVLIDSSGALTGILLLILVRAVILKIKNAGNLT